MWNNFYFNDNSIDHSELLGPVPCGFGNFPTFKSLNINGTHYNYTYNIINYFNYMNIIIETIIAIKLTRNFLAKYSTFRTYRKEIIV